MRSRRSKRLLFAALAFAATALLRVAGSAATSGGAPDGKAIFAATCSACHSATGAGSGPYPPLAGNAFVTSDDTATLIGTVLNGRTGPIVVNGASYGGTMPAWRGRLSAAEVAAVLTYVRSAWTNKAAAISADQVAAAFAPSAQSGAGLFLAKCAGCHQPNGQGSAAYPPLAGNPDVIAGDPKGIVATVVNGRSGPLAVGGKAYDGKMPAWKGALSDADIAAVVTYVRSAWGNAASAVTEQQVAGAGSAVSAAIGASVYSKNCMGCHKANGQGGAGGTFPALAGDALVTAPDAAKMLATIEHGRNLMPAWKGQLSPGDIAAVATYVRSAWGNKASPVTEQDVTAIK
jgi:cbb3-type cytochrome c oxidase subunit III